MRHCLGLLIESSHLSGSHAQLLIGVLQLDAALYQGCLYTRLVGIGLEIEGGAMHGEAQVVVHLDDEGILALGYIEVGLALELHFTGM